MTTIHPRAVVVHVGTTHCNIRILLEITCFDLSDITVISWEALPRVFRQLANADPECRQGRLLATCKLMLGYVNGHSNVILANYKLVLSSITNIDCIRNHTFNQKSPYKVQTMTASLLTVGYCSEYSIVSYYERHLRIKE